jgi:hypothetical protein
LPQSITIRFDREADDAAKKGTEAIFDMDGKPVVMEGLFKHRRKAQMDSKYARLLKARAKDGVSK